MNTYKYEITARFIEDGEVHRIRTNTLARTARLLRICGYEIVGLQKIHKQ
jgi:uncharacterized protein with PIN domain